MANQLEVKSLVKLPKYNARTIDITPVLNFSKFELLEGCHFEDYMRIARSVGRLFHTKDLVEIVAKVLTIPPATPSEPETYTVHVHGRSSETGQRYSVIMM